MTQNVNSQSYERDSSFERLPLYSSVVGALQLTFRSAVTALYHKHEGCLNVITSRTRRKFVDEVCIVDFHA